MTEFEADRARPTLAVAPVEDDRGAGGPTIRRSVAIRNRRGLHARAAAKFVKLAGEFEARVEVSRDGMTVGGQSIMGLMMLAAGCGSTITLIVDGPDAEAAAAALTELVERLFDED